MGTSPISYNTWDPSELVQKVIHNHPLAPLDYRSPFIRKYLDFLERVCLRTRTATARELQAILMKWGRIRVGNYYIFL